MKFYNKIIIFIFLLLIFIILSLFIFITYIINYYFLILLLISFSSFYYLKFLNYNSNLNIYIFENIIQYLFNNVFKINILKFAFFSIFFNINFIYI